MQESAKWKVCGREFSAEDVEWIRGQLAGSVPSRAELARRVCERLDWRDERGEAKAMSCRVALLRLHREGVIELPAPRNGNGNRQGLSKQRVILPSEPEAIVGSVEQLGGVELKGVEKRGDSALWNTLIERYHYLGYQRLPGAQRRYLIYSRQRLLGALGFGAAAWTVGVRDRWIGWSGAQRQAHLGRVVNNARFLLLPWVRCRNLASKVLAMSERCVVEDFERRYGLRPVLMETFVEHGRYRGSCYRAANWRYVGQTQGRGKCDRWHKAPLPVKDVYVRPLVAGFRAQLGVAR